MLGHASAAMTLDVYSDLFDDDLDAIGIALDQARSLATVPKMCPPDAQTGTSRMKVPPTCTDGALLGGGGDLNPGTGLPHTAFRVLHLRPLGHATAKTVPQVTVDAKSIWSPAVQGACRWRHKVLLGLLVAAGQLVLSSPSFSSSSLDDLGNLSLSVRSPSFSLAWFTASATFSLLARSPSFSLGGVDRVGDLLGVSQVAQLLLGGVDGLGDLVTGIRHW